MRRCREFVVRFVVGVCKFCFCFDVWGDVCSFGSFRFYCSLYLWCVVKIVVGGNLLDLLWSCFVLWI